MSRTDVAQTLLSVRVSPGSRDCKRSRGFGLSTDKSVCASLCHIGPLACGGRQEAQ